MVRCNQRNPARREMVTTEQIFVGEDGTQVGNYEFESFVNSDGTTVWDKTYYRKCEEMLSF